MPQPRPKRDDAPFRGAAFGLVFASPERIPGMAPAPENAAADVEVRFSPVPAGLTDIAANPGAWTVLSRRRAVLDHRDIRVLVEDGARVTVDVLDPAARNVAGLLLGYGAALVILHQRALMPLHAAAVAGPAGAALLIGGPGAGKSTLAAQLARAGLALAGDDLVRVDFSAPAPAVHRSAGGVKLFADSAARLAAGAPRLPGEAGKEVLAFAAGDAPWPVPLRAVFLLGWLHPADATAEIAPVAPLQALPALRAAVARPELVAPMGLEAAYVALLARLAAAVSCRRLHRPRSFAAAGAAVAAIAAALEEGRAP